MANLKSSQKDIRRTVRRTERNQAVQTRLKTLRKKTVASPSADNAASYMSALDKAAKSGLVHPNKVNREKSKIARGKLSAKVS